MAARLKHRMTAQALGDTVFPYLTTVEGLKLAALGFSKEAAKLSSRAGQTVLLLVTAGTDAHPCPCM